MMALKLIYLTPEEKTKLDMLYRKLKKEAIWTIVAVAVVSLIVSVLPIGILQFFSDTETRYRDDSSQSMLQQWGFGTWLIIFILFISLWAFLILLGKKIFKLRKDLKEGQKMELEAIIVSKYADEKTGDYHMHINSGNLKNKKILLAREQFNQFSEGQNMKIDVYKNSMILLSK